jgi:hypothetical protein
MIQNFVKANVCFDYPWRKMQNVEQMLANDRPLPLQSLLL